MANQEMCQRVLDYLLMHPEEHKQSTWFYKRTWRGANMCGTAMCTAGAAAYLSGRLSFSPRAFPRLDGQIVRVGHYAGFREVGIEELGLTSEEADHLFSAGNDDAIHCLKKLANGEPILDREGNLLPELR